MKLASSSSKVVTVTHSCSRTLSILQLRNALANKLGIKSRADAAALRLSHQGRDLKDNHTLAEVGVLSHETLTLTLPLLGGTEPSPSVHSPQKIQTNDDAGDMVKLDQPQVNDGNPDSRAPKESKREKRKIKDEKVNEVVINKELEQRLNKTSFYQTLSKQLKQNFGGLFKTDQVSKIKNIDLELGFAPY